MSNSAPQPFKLRSRHRDASATASADTKALQPDVSSSASVDAFDTNAGAQFDPPREEKTTTTAIDAEIAQTSPAGSIKLRSSFRDPQASKADLKNPQDPPATTVAVDSKETTPDEKAASSTQPEVPVKETVPQPFKLRSRHRNSLAATSIDTKTQQPEVFQVASADAGEETGGSLPKDAKTTKIDSEITQAPPSGSIKLRSLYRDSQLKTSLGSDAEKQTGFEETQDESVVVVNHEISSQRENAAPADNSDPVATRPAGTFKLRASFRDPRVTSTGQQTTEKGIPGETVAKPDSTSATSNTDGKRDSGRSTMIQWRSKKNETSTGSDARANEKASAEPTSNVTRQANHHSISMRRSSGASANSTDADIVGSSHGSASEVRRELRGSIWDNASAPPVDGDSGTAGSRVEVRKKAPLPPGGAGIKQTSFSDSERQSRADSVSNANSDSRSVAQPENVTSSTEDSLVTDLDSEASSPSRQNKRPRATEDDHAASTRAILSSGPIERLARLTGIPSSSASALLGVIGIAMLIGGLWMIRATMGFRQS